MFSRVGVKQDVPNFGYKNPDSGEFEGLEIDIARKITRQLGVDIEFTPVTAQTRGPLLDNGQVDLVFITFTITEDAGYSTISQLLTTQMPLASWSIG